MAALQEAFAEAVKLNRQITQGLYPRHADENSVCHRWRDYADRMEEYAHHSTNPDHQKIRRLQPHQRPPRRDAAGGRGV